MIQLTGPTLGLKLKLLTDENRTEPLKSIFLLGFFYNILWSTVDTVLFSGLDIPQLFPSTTQTHTQSLVRELFTLYSPQYDNGDELYGYYGYPFFTDIGTGKTVPSSLAPM